VTHCALPSFGLLDSRMPANMILKPLHPMSDMELEQMREAELEHRCQIALGRGYPIKRTIETWAISRERPAAGLPNRALAASNSSVHRSTALGSISSGASSLNSPARCYDISGLPPSRN
jgi:hypothetical protein